MIAPRPRQEQGWIRGVNIGGWLVLERWITPFLFGLTNCHLDGDFCRYPDQILGKDGVLLPECNLTKCVPVSTDNVDGGRFPMDEYTLTSAFPEKETARKYLEHHYDTFVTKQDVELLKKSGMTHVRVPLGYWILGDVHEDEPYVDGGWPYFKRLCHWCREIGLEVWPDLHGVPGSQNGFDNSGQTKKEASGKGWCTSTENVHRSLDVIHHISLQIAEDGLEDVVTGFGLLNEIFLDCDFDIVRNFTQNGFEIVRSVLGDEIAVYSGDRFDSDLWNDGWWLDEPNTYLDSHTYHVFFEAGRNLSPRQHIAYVCTGNERDVVNCCYEDYPNNTIPSRGISRIIGEWTGCFDQLPKKILIDIMDSIAANGTAAYFDRQLPMPRQNFLRNFVEAQMVTYEAASYGVSSGWFFWNFKMEGGAYAEWDFIRGLQEGWIPPMPPPNVPSVQIYGTCEEIIFRTDDNYTLIDEIPDPNTLNWVEKEGWWTLDDDVVKTHGQSLLPDYVPPREHSVYRRYALLFILCIAIVVVVRRLRRRASKKHTYIELLS
jgi:glucan 1,3-beta-glucosidase